MAGKFINNNQKIMLDNAVDSVKTILNNPYYLYSDKKGSVSQYYNINTTKTTLDEATRANYSELGPNSPIRYNKIKNTILYGIGKIDIDLDIGDNGLEASEIAGEAVILPNTFIPYPGDFFTLDQIGKPYLFKVTGVNPNTLDTGAILYKINYVLAYTDLHGIEKQVVEDYNMILNNVGSNFKAVITSTKYDLINELELYCTKLKDYYNMIFYNDKVQTFTYVHSKIINAYDPYLIEFIIRNNILKGSTEYIYVSQQMFLPSTFGVDYDRTIFAALEDNNKDKSVIRFIGNLLLIDQKMSLLYAYSEDYYYMEYSHLNTKLHSINIFDLDILKNIRDNIKTGKIMTDIMIKYFNNEPITHEDLHMLKEIDYCENMELYYGIPITIFCLEKIIINILS